MKNPFRRKAQQPEDTAVAVQDKARLTPDGLLITEFPTAVTRILRLADNLGQSYSAIFESQHNVRTVVDEIARECAQLSLKMYEKVPRTDMLPSARIEVPDHPMMQLFEEPVPGEYEDEFGFWYKTFADILIYDIAHWQVIPQRGVPKALLRLPPDAITPDRDPTTMWVRGWRTSTGQVIPRNQVITFWGYDPTVNHGSVSPMETLRRLLSEEIARDANRRGMWKRSLRKDGVVEVDMDGRELSDDAKESWLIDAEDSLAGGDQSGRPLILEPGWKWKSEQFSPRDMEYLRARQMSRQEVAAIYHVPPAKVAAAENGAQIDEMTHDEFYQATLPPYLSRVESVIQAQLLPKFDLLASVRRRRYVKFNLDEKLRGSFEDIAAIGATTAGGPVVTVNEWRTRLDLPPVEGFDGLYVPLNSARAGGPQASPQNPIATPASGVEPAGTTPGGGVAPMAVPAEPVLRAAAHPSEVLEQFEEQKLLAEKEAQRKERVEKYRPQFEKVVEHHFARQAKSGKMLNADRWHREFADDLFAVAVVMLDDAGKDTSNLKARLVSTATAINNETAQIAQTANLPELTDTVDPFTEERVVDVAGKLVNEYA